MIQRIGSNGWYLLFAVVQDVLSVLFPVREFPKLQAVGWERYEVVNECDPYRPLGCWDHGIVSVKQKSFVPMLLKRRIA